MKTTYASLRTGARFEKLVRPRGGTVTHRLTGRVVSRQGDDLIVRFDDQTRTAKLMDARGMTARGELRKPGRK